MDTLDPMKGQGECIVIPGGYVFAAQDLGVTREVSGSRSPIVRYVTPEARYYPDFSIEAGFIDLCRSRRRISRSFCLNRSPSFAIRAPL